VLLLLLGGHLSVMMGKKPMAISSLFFLMIGSLVLGAAGAFWSFLIALLLMGIGYGLFETAMNGAALDWELATGRRILNLVHGSFNGGAAVGALATGGRLAAEWHPARALGAVASLAAAMLFATAHVAYPRLGTGRIADVPGSTLRLLLTRRSLRRLSLI